MITHIPARGEEYALHLSRGVEVHIKVDRVLEDHGPSKTTGIYFTYQENGKTATGAVLAGAKGYRPLDQFQEEAERW